MTSACPATLRNRLILKQAAGRSDDVQLGFSLLPARKDAGWVERHSQVPLLSLEEPPRENQQVRRLDLGRI